MNLAACFNDPATMRRFESASFHAKARAILVAAEQKNYDSFEGMVYLFLTRNTGPDFMLALGRCDEWRRVRQLAEKDEKLSGLINATRKKALPRSARRQSDHAADHAPVTATVMAPAHPSGLTLLGRLKFW